MWDPATSKMELFVAILRNFCHKELHLRCCRDPRSMEPLKTTKEFTTKMSLSVVIFLKLGAQQHKRSSPQPSSTRSNFKSSKNGLFAFFFDLRKGKKTGDLF